MAERTKMAIVRELQLLKAAKDLSPEIRLHMAKQLNAELEAMVSFEKAQGELPLATATGGVGPTKEGQGAKPHKP